MDLVEIFSVILVMVYLRTLSIVSNCVTTDGCVTVNNELERMRNDGRGRRSCNTRSLTGATEENLRISWVSSAELSYI